MEFIKALTFVTDDPRWKEKVAIGSVLALLSFLIVPVLILLGYWRATAREPSVSGTASIAALLTLACGYMAGRGEFGRRVLVGIGLGGALHGLHGGFQLGRQRRLRECRRRRQGQCHYCGRHHMRGSSEV